MGLQLRLAASLCLSCWALTACGHAAKRGAPIARATPCAPAARAAFARFLALTPGAVTAVPSIGNNTMPQCTFTTGKGVSLTANIYTGPQPYFLLMRQTVETGQMVVPSHAAPAPQTISGLGIEATWFPAQDQLMSTDGVRLITATVQWSGASESRRVALATALSRTYLKAPRAR